MFPKFLGTGSLEQIGGGLDLCRRPFSGGVGCDLDCDRHGVDIACSTEYLKKRDERLRETFVLILSPVKSDTGEHKLR
jgi:hypothetical protein